MLLRFTSRINQNALYRSMKQPQAVACTHKHVLPPCSLCSAEKPAQNETNKLTLRCIAPILMISWNPLDSFASSVLLESAKHTCCAHHNQACPAPVLRIPPHAMQLRRWQVHNAVAANAFL